LNSDLITVSILIYLWLIERHKTRLETNQYLRHIFKYFISIFFRPATKEIVIKLIYFVYFFEKLIPTSEHCDLDPFTLKVTSDFRHVISVFIAEIVTFISSDYKLFICRCNASVENVL